jgi:hypothetical protein
MSLRPILRFAAVAALACVSAAWTPHSHRARATDVTVFKDPNCGCCKLWVDHLRKHAFAVSARDTSDVTAVKRAGRVPEKLYSCHTAFVGGYVIEGHVPAADIQRLLKEKPKIAGIGVPGMPAGSPGMEVGGRVDRYDVVAFNRDGTTRIFARH